jgi:cysteine desulfurase family protein
METDCTKRDIYFDNASTSWPKPPQMIAAMKDFIDNIGGNPGRSGHTRSFAAGDIVEDTRRKIARLFGVRDPKHVIFGPNCSFGLSLAIRGVLKPGDHAIATQMDHNSVLRPLRFMEQKCGVEMTIVECRHDGTVDPAAVRAAVRPNTKLICGCHASNVVGTKIDLSVLAEIAHQAGAYLLADSAQSAGVIPIDMERDGIDLLAFAGHKGLMGPHGTGGLCLRHEIDMDPLILGGTGSTSEKDTQPDELPDRYEAGTGNVIGLAGLGASLDFVEHQGMDTIRRKEEELTARLLAGLDGIEGVRVCGPGRPQQQTAVVSITFEGLQPLRAGKILDEKYGIASRVGLHCAPHAHRAIGTFPRGTVRFGLGYFNTPDEVDFCSSAVSELASSRR